MQSGHGDQKGLRPCSVGTIWSFWIKNIKKRNEITGVEYSATGRGCRSEENTWSETLHVEGFPGLQTAQISETTTICLTL